MEPTFVQTEQLQAVPEAVSTLASNLTAPQ
jgi:hypothetical protein